MCRKPIGRPLGGRGPRENLQSKISRGSEEQQNERAMIFYKKIVASDMPLVAAPWAAGGPAEVCGAKFRGEKEEQGSGRMTLF